MPSPVLWALSTRHFGYCPLLSWGKTDGKQFWKSARVPTGMRALFAVLMVYFVTYLVPSYNAVIAAGGINAEGLMEEGPAWYYNGLAAVGLLVASLLFFNSLFMLGRAVRGYQKRAWRQSEGVGCLRHAGESLPRSAVSSRTSAWRSSWWA